MQNEEDVMNNVKNILVDKIMHSTFLKNKNKETASGGTESSSSAIGNGGGNMSGGSIVNTLYGPYKDDMVLGGGGTSTSGVFKMDPALKFKILHNAVKMKPKQTDANVTNNMADDSQESLSFKLMHSSSSGSSAGNGGSVAGGVSGGLGSGISVATILETQSPMHTNKSRPVNKKLELINDIIDDSSTIPWHKLLSLPPKQMIVVDRMHSGARRYITLDFGSPIILTDVVSYISLYDFFYAMTFFF